VAAGVNADSGGHREAVFFRRRQPRLCGHRAPRTPRSYAVAGATTHVVRRLGLVAVTPAFLWRPWGRVLAGRCCRSTPEGGDRRAGSGRPCRPRGQPESARTAAGLIVKGKLGLPRIRLVSIGPHLTRGCPRSRRSLDRWCSERCRFLDLHRGTDWWVGCKARCLL